MCNQLMDASKNNEYIYKNNFFDIKHYFEKLECWDVNIFPTKINECSFFGTMIKDYKNILNKLYKEEHNKIKEYIMYPKENYQFFEKTFTLGNDGSYYNVIWNVNILDNLIKSSSFNKTNLSMDLLDKSIKTATIQNYGLIKTNKNKDYPLIGYFKCVKNPYFIIDGNHRIINKYSMGNKNVDCYVLGYKEFKEGLISDLYKSLIAIHQNLQWAVCYIIGEIPFEAYKLLVDPIINDLY